MRYDHGTWEMARRIVTQQGSKAMHEAHDCAHRPSLYRDDRHDRIIEVVRAMDLLLSDEGNGAAH